MESDNNGLQLEVLWVIPNILTASNCLHVTLLVILRLLAVERPMQYEDIHAKFQCKPLIIIWIFSTTVCLLPVISSPFSQDNQSARYFHKFCREIVLHGCHTVPICMIIIMYSRMLWTISKSIERITSAKHRPQIILNIEAQRLKKELTRMVAGIVICLIICYVPYLIQWQIDILKERNTCDISSEWVCKNTIHRYIM